MTDSSARPRPSRFAAALRATVVASTALAATLPIAAHAQQAVYPVVVPNDPDPLLANLTIPADAAQAGMWSRAIDWPIVAIHASVLPDGRVLTFGAAQGGQDQDGRTLVFWDPRKGSGANALQVLPNAQNVDSFCASAVLLSDGKLIVSGGASYSTGYSSRESMVVDWRNSLPKRDYDLVAQRWYGTMTKLPDGRAIMTGGGAPYASADPNRAEAAPDISSTPEVYAPGQGWRSLTGAYSTDAFGAKNARWWYPRQWVSPTGTLFGISTEKMWEMRLDGNGAIRTVGNFKTAANNDTRPNVGPTSTAVMYDAGKILQVGGNGYNNGYASPSSAAATIFDINAIGQGRVTVTETAGMRNPRQWANAVALPNGQVLVTGGSRYADQAGDNAVMAAETWNPATGRWTTGASANIYRGYHSSAVLLLNGAVLTSGGGVPGPVVNRNSEIYYPAYLFARAGGGSTLAARPRIVSLSTNASDYGQSIDVQSATGDDVQQVSLIALGSVTHSFDSNQRRLTLPFTRMANGIKVAMPTSANLAPPGYYMLSTVNAAGVPSVGAMIAIGAAAPGSGNQNGATVTQPTRTLVEGTAIKLDTVTWPGYLLRHANFNGYISKIDANSAALDRMDASFIVRKGRSDGNCYSFESANYPGMFLQHANYLIVLKNGNDDVSRRGQTYCARPAVNGSANADEMSFESIDQPGHFLRHRNFRMMLLKNDEKQGDATWRVSAAGTVAGGEVALQPSTWPGYLIRHTGYDGYISQIGVNSAALDKLDASYFVRPGLADNRCVSFESKNVPGSFLRHQNFRIRLLPREGQTDRDATFCPRRALNGSIDMGVVSLESLSWPGYFIRHANFALYIMKDDGSANHKTDTSFIAKPTPR